jgi:hypothetical protein
MTGLYPYIRTFLSIIIFQQVKQDIFLYLVSQEAANSRSCHEWMKAMGYLLGSNCNKFSLQKHICRIKARDQSEFSNIPANYSFFSGSFIKENMDSLNRNLNFDPISRDIYNNSAVRFSSKLNTKINNRTVWRSGIQASYHTFHYQSLTVRRSQGRPVPHLMDKGQTSMVQFFTQWKHRFSKDLSSTFGFHSTIFN